jgi:hypothetical protein
MVYSFSLVVHSALAGFVETGQRRFDEFAILADNRANAPASRWFFRVSHYN